MKKLLLLFLLFSVATLCFANGAIEKVVDTAVDWNTTNNTTEYFKVNWDKDTLKISSVITNMNISFSSNDKIQIKIETDERKENFSISSNEDFSFAFREKEKNRKITLSLPSSYKDCLFLTSVTGDISLSGFNGNALIMENVSGDLTLKNTNLNELKITQGTGDINTDNVKIENVFKANINTGETTINTTSAESLKLEYVTGNTTIIDSFFNKADISGVIGRFRGDFNFNDLILSTTTGSIELELDDINLYNYTLSSSVGEIKVADITTRGAYMNQGSSNKTIKISSSTGKIKIY